MERDELGKRVKRYEAASNQLLLNRSPLFIRIDGKAFHTFTRGLKKPYSDILSATMVYAAKQTAKEMMGFKLAYVQSDEATFMLTDYDTHDTQGWFGYELNKVVSISASLFTAHFNEAWQTQREEVNKGPRLALFDSRAFTVPREDAPNIFIWRQRDWERNSIQMLARSNFSQNELHGKDVLKMEYMLRCIGVDPDSRTDAQKYGTFIEKDFTLTHNPEDYLSIAERIPEYGDE